MRVAAAQGAVRRKIRCVCQGWYFGATVLSAIELVDVFRVFRISGAVRSVTQCLVLAELRFSWGRIHSNKCAKKAYALPRNSKIMFPANDE